MEVVGASVCAACADDGVRPQPIPSRCSRRWARERLACVALGGKRRGREGGRRGGSPDGGSPGPGPAETPFPGPAPLPGFQWGPAFSPRPRGSR